MPRDSTRRDFMRGGISLTLATIAATGAGCATFSMDQPEYRIVHGPRFEVVIIRKGKGYVRDRTIFCPYGGFKDKHGRRRPYMRRLGELIRTLPEWDADYTKPVPGGYTAIIVRGDIWERATYKRPDPFCNIREIKNGVCYYSLRRIEIRSRFIDKKGRMIPRDKDLGHEAWHLPHLGKDYHKNPPREAITYIGRDPFIIRQVKRLFSYSRQENKPLQ